MRQHCPSKRMLLLVQNKVDGKVDRGREVYLSALRKDQLSD